MWAMAAGDARLMQDWSLATPDGRLAGYRFGPKPQPDVVFLHANGFTARTYQSLLAPMAPGLTLLAYDQRGHGRSQLPIAPKRLQNWAVFRDDLIAVLEAVAPNGAVLAGHSLGANVAMMAALKRPDLVRGLALAEPVILPELTYLAFALPGMVMWSRQSLPIAARARKRRAQFDSREQAFDGYNRRPPFSLWREPFLADYLAEGLIERESGFELACVPRWEAAIYAAQRHHPWSAIGPQFPATILLRGDVQSTCVEPAARKIMLKSPAISVETIRGASHFLPMERPYLLRNAITRVIDMLENGLEPKRRDYGAG